MYPHEPRHPAADPLSTGHPHGPGETNPNHRRVTWSSR
jgi:hypothetical protein